LDILDSCLYIDTTRRCNRTLICLRPAPPRWRHRRMV